MALPCHYCGESGGTKDHVVAKHWLGRRPGSIPQFAAEANKVPACQRCNNLKSHFRSDCECPICEHAWVVMAPFILPRVKRDIPVKPVLAILRGDVEWDGVEGVG